MKLNELIRLRNQLSCALDISILNLEIEKNYTSLTNLANCIDPELSTGITQIANNHKEINLSFQHNINQINEMLSVIQTKINLLSTKFFEENYQLELTYVDAESIRKIRSLKPGGEPETIVYFEPSMLQDLEANLEIEAIDSSNVSSLIDSVSIKESENVIEDSTPRSESYEKFEQMLIQRINLYSNWQYPALEIGCRDGAWTKLLVASDPLYIADVFDDFLHSAVQQFPPLYQGRVRKYLMKDFYKIDNLPKNQFGLIFSYNFFNYLSIDSIKQLLIQSMSWLRPGGTIVLTYNNADLPAAASYAENYFMTYVPESILVPLAESIGFETVFSYNSEPAFSILELRKPGQLTSIKAGQTAGEIKFIPLDISSKY